MTPDNNRPKNHLVIAYQQMMSRVRETLEQASHKTLQQHIEAAQEKAVELNELSREEAERVGNYLSRDLQDAAEFISTTEQALVNWMRFDLELIEDRLLAMFSLMVDHTRQELENLAERARQATEWYSGEITGPGTLSCDSCGKTLHFHQPDYIPVCPNCGATLFKRVSEEGEIVE
jgi:rubrerythrin